MTALRDELILNFEEFLSFLDGRAEEERWELHDGVLVRMMTPPSFFHSIIVNDIQFLLTEAQQRLGADWEVCPGLGVFVPGPRDSAAAPDILVTREKDAPDNYTRGPVVLVEVLSPSTGRRADEGWKKEAYRRLPSLAHYLIVDQLRMRVRVFARSGLPATFTESDELVPLPAIGVGLPLAGIYRRTPFDPAVTR